MSKLVEKLRELAELPKWMMQDSINWQAVESAIATTDFAALLAEAERLEAKASNWRIGMAVTPKLKSHRFYGCIGVVREIVDGDNPQAGGRGDNLVIDAWGQFAVHKLTEPADDWKTA